MTPRAPQPEPFELGLRGALTRTLARRRRAPVPPVPFIVGATRSGTTLLRLMLDAHPQLALPSETHFIPDLLEACESRQATPGSLLELMVAQRRWGDFRLDPDELLERFRALDPLSGPDAVRAFFRLYAEGQGKTRWGDKTPGYVKKMRLIQAELPEARFVHLIRDGRDVALSVLKMSFGPQTIEAAAERWKDRIDRGRSHARFTGHYLEIHFEDLILDTEGTLRKICEFIELDFDPAMLTYYEGAEERLAEKARELSRRKGEAQSAEARMQSHAKTLEPPKPEMVSGWKTKMDPDDVRRYEAVAGDLLKTLGYETAATGGSEEVHVPKRSPRIARPAKRALAGAVRLAGRAGDGEDRPPAPFIVGMTRGGHELVAEMLRAHPGVAIPPETGFVPNLAETIRSEPVTVERVVRMIAASREVTDYGFSEDELRSRLNALEELKAAPVIREFYAMVAEAQGVERFGEVTGAYLTRMRRVQRALSEARFVHIVRDGRDLIAARPGEIETGKAMVMAQKWVKRVGGSLEDQARLDHYMQVRYEDLITDREATVRRICDFVCLDFEPSILTAEAVADAETELGPIGTWRARLSADDVAAFEEVGGELLTTLGYELSVPVG